MTRHRNIPRRRSLRPVAALLPMPPLAGCSGPPAIDVVGSYVPAWLLCCLIGIAAAVCVRQLLILATIEDRLLFAPVTHAAIALAVTLAVWLVWFGH